MKKLFSAALVLLTAALPVSVAAQAFEGVIEFKKMSDKDTTNYVYYVKGDKVRIDEIGSRSKKVEGSFLIDTKAGTMKFLSHDRKTWGEHKPGATNTAGGKPTVSKTGATKTMHGYKVSEYLVKNPDEGTQISFWVTSGGKFNFFRPMIKQLNRKEKFAIYYLLLDVKEGSVSFMAVQSDMSGKETGRLEVTKIQKKAVDASQFEVPKDYKEFK